MHFVECHSIRIQSIVLQLCAKYLSPLSLFFTGKRKRADTLLTTVQDMLVSEAEQQRQSDACFDSMVHFFQEQGGRRAHGSTGGAGRNQPTANNSHGGFPECNGQDGGKARSTKMMSIFKIMSTLSTCK